MLLQLRKQAAVEQELLKAQASGLGITGRRLQSSLSQYRQHRDSGSPPGKTDESLAKICERLQELLIQRESIGIPHENLEWVLRTYEVPLEALAKLGLQP